ncbi:ankyrin repeat and BTB/POZ domain-containing protein 2-like [Periophthalmus magnuspinnatus]|uniref:ankyrin repeat and BTB/POZ domain-containing protein 2-like n=1 Tax=Periophthalmus magnuspinnatus TaxID=409849 RepID=UPI00145BF84A|nr:ankyrin repeat and BTB/POZ domain-containing protein 2-like [Periophthalmus magnuspinnatus]
MTSLEPGHVRRSASSGSVSSSGGSWDARSGSWFNEDLLQSLPRLPELEDYPWSAHELRELVRRVCGWDAFTGDAVRRLSAVMRNPLMRIAREAQRLSAVHRRCTRLEVQSAVRVVLSTGLSERCVAAAVRAVSLHCMSSDTARTRSKSSSCGLLLSVGRFFRWMVDTRVSVRVREYAAVYLTACTERLVEEIVVRALHAARENHEPGPVTAARLDSTVDLDPELWAPLQVHAQLLSGRNAHGELCGHALLSCPAPQASTESREDMYLQMELQSLEQALSGATVSSLPELCDLVSRAMHFLYRPQPAPSAPSANHTLVSWTPDALHTLYYFVSAPQTEHMENLQSSNMTLTREKCPHLLPPLSSWLHISLMFSEHRRSSVVDSDDVRQSCRVLLHQDCEPTLLRSDSSVSSSWRSLDAASALGRFRSDLGFKMLCSGRVDLLKEASNLLGERGVDTVDERGLSALMYASAAGDEALVQVLIQARAQLDLKVPVCSRTHPSVSPGTRHWTALTLAVLHSHLSVAQLLLEAGADVEAQVGGAQDCSVETPLQLASSAGDYEMVSLLLSYGADPLLPVHHGSSALSENINCFSCAAAHGHRNIVRRLVLQPAPCREDVLSLEEILAEGVDQGHPWEKGTQGTLRMCKARLKALQEASYYSAEHGYLDVTLDIRDMGVPWSVHSWLQSVLRAHDQGRDRVVLALLQDFGSISSENYSPEFRLTGVSALFNLLHNTKDYMILQRLAWVLSLSYGPSPVPPVPPLDVSLSTHLDVHFLNNQEMSDVTFMIEGRPFFAHRVLLISASDRFGQLLNESPDAIIHIDHMTYSTFQLMMKSLYCGGTPGVTLAYDEALKLFPVSVFFRLRSLQRSCEVTLSQGLTVDNAVAVYRVAKLNSATELVSFCEGFFLQNLPSLLEREDFHRLLLGSCGLEKTFPETELHSGAGLDQDQGQSSRLLMDLETALKERLVTLCPSCRD